MKELDRFINRSAGTVPKFQDDLDVVCKMLKEHTMVERYALIGSALYMPDPKDVDLAVLTPWEPMRAGKKRFPCMRLADELIKDGWTFCDADYQAENSTWTSIRKGNVNLMLTHELEFYSDYVRAMEVCKALKLQSKRDRVLVCKIVRDHLSADDALSHPQIKELDKDF